MPIEFPDSLPEDKLFYGIGELSEALGLDPSTLRFWEKEFDQLDPGSTPGGQRRYERADVKTVLRIQHLVHEECFTLEGARGKLADWESYRHPRRLGDAIRQRCNRALKTLGEFMDSL